MSGKSNCHLLCPGVIVRKAFNIVIKCVMSGRCKQANLTHSAAVSLTPDTSLRNSVFTTKRNRTNWCTETLRETDANGVEVLSVIGKRCSGCDMCIPDASTIKVHCNSACVRSCA